MQNRISRKSDLFPSDNQKPICVKFRQDGWIFKIFYVISSKGLSTSNISLFELPNKNVHTTPLVRNVIYLNTCPKTPQIGHRLGPNDEESPVTPLRVCEL